MNFPKNYRIIILHPTIIIIYCACNIADYTKFLILTVGYKLTWKIHIAEVIKKLNNAHYVILIQPRSVDDSTLMMVCCGYVYPILNYGIHFWGSSNKRNKLFKLQK